MNINLEVFLAILNKGLFVLAPMALIESIYLYRSGKLDVKETAANLTIAFCGKFIKLYLTGNILFLFLMPFYEKRIIHWLDEPSLWSFLITFLLADFIYYWNHRLSHEIRLLWSYHSVHHSSEAFNLSTALRLPWLGTRIDGFFYIPAVFLGFNPYMILISKALILIGQFWIHSENIGKLGWFDRYFNSPSNHKVHHGSNPVYLDKNHGGILIIWDRIFGTYAPEIEPVQYGLTKPINSKNPIYINFYEPYRIIKDVFKTNTFKGKIDSIFGKPR